MATQYANGRIITSGLVLALDAADRNSYVSGSTLWNDVSGNGNNGTLTNGPTFNSANGGSIVLNGSNDYIETNYVPITNNSFTVMVWAKSISNGFSNRLLGNGDSTGGLSGMDIIWGAPGPDSIYAVRRAGNNDGFGDVIGTPMTNIAIGWHHIVCSYNHTAIGSILYFDSIQVGTNTALGFSSSLTFRIGRDGNGTDNFNGSTSNVLLYNRALSSQEVLQNYNAQKSRFGLT